MIPQSMAALLSSIVSQVSLLILLLHPSLSSPFLSISSSADPAATNNQLQTLLPLLLHNFLTSSTAAVSRKRKPTSDPDSDDTHFTISPRLAELGRVNPGLIVNPSSFRAHFNMSPSTFEWLSDLLEPLLDCRDPIGSPLNLSPELRLGIGLYRLSTGSDFPEIARVFRVTELVAMFCSKQLCRVLCTNFRFWVGFPNSTEVKSVSDGFQSLTGLPNCCGVIGCVRFTIKRVNGEDQVIASQIVVDSNSRILNIVAGFHGDLDNLKILKSSTLYKDIESGRLLNSPPIEVDDDVSAQQYFVGDSGYPLLPWLMVPFLDPNSGLPEQNFDCAVRLMRGPLMKTVASLKGWGVLRRPIEGEMRTAVAYLGACAILHNALLIRDDFAALCTDIKLDATELHHDYGLGSSFDLNVVQESNDSNAILIRSALAKMANLNLQR